MSTYESEGRQECVHMKVRGTTWKSSDAQVHPPLIHYLLILFSYLLPFILVFSSSWLEYFSS